MRVSAEEFRRRTGLRVHSFLSDVQLHDVTVIRLHDGGDNRTLSDFTALLSSDELQRANPIVSSLFKLRWALGRVFKWESPGTSASATSYVHRLTDEDRSRLVDLPGLVNENIAPFRLTYSFADEALLEVENATGHHFLHLSLEQAPGGYVAYWAVYVRKTSWLTPAYMALIDPFRRFLVYPATMKFLATAWKVRYS